MFSGTARDTRSTSTQVARAVVATLAAPLLFASACGRETSGPIETVATWSVDSAPSLVIGLDAAHDTSVAFERITGATQLPTGQLLVADLGDTPLRLFEPDGRFVRAVAWKGGGPGEMEYLARLWRCGDAIYTYDIDGYRISEYGVDATFRRVFRFAVPDGQQVPYSTACNATGRFAHLGWGNAPRVAGYHRDTVAIWITPTADGTPTVLDSVPSSERWGQTYQGRLVGSMPLPLGKQPSIAYGPRGFFVATGDAVEVLAYDTLGVSLGRFSLGDSVPAVTPADIRDFIEAEIAEDGEQRRASIEREYAAITFPEKHGAVTALLVDSEGLLWLRAYAPPSAATVTWRVLSADGREVAQVMMPRQLEIFEIGRDYVLGREVDREEGVPVLQRWRINRTAPVND